MHKISAEFKFRPDRTTATDFGQIGPLTTELAALEHQNISHRHNGKMSKIFPVDL